jgi:hypothetical protein
MVAAARAVATRQPHPIINDPWAAPLVEAVGIESLSRMVQLGTPPEDSELGSDLRLQPVIDSFAVRTRFFDEFFTTATNSGIRQIVILAAGLDSRAYRFGRTVRSSMKWIYRQFFLQGGRFLPAGVAPLASHRQSRAIFAMIGQKLRSNGFDGYCRQHGAPKDC